MAAGIHPPKKNIGFTSIPYMLLTLAVIRTGGVASILRQKGHDMRVHEIRQKSQKYYINITK